MTYHLLFTARAKKQLQKLDKATQRLIKAWTDKNLEGTDDPRRHGKSMTGNWSGYWRYRVGDYRIVADIRDGEAVIVAIEIGHRREIYR